MDVEDPKDVVRRGYDLLSVRYERAFGGETKYGQDWLGGGVAMWWSHADAATNRSWLVRAGLDVVHEEFVPQGNSGHVLFWARRTAA
ncbi:hypothetical protein [Kitasatospora sp. NPDC001132]